MSDHRSLLRESIKRSAETIESLSHQLEDIEKAADLIIKSLDAGCKVLTAGYGGSAADALHMAEELTGRFDKDRRSLPAVSLVADPTLMTCIANDYGFDHVFSRPVEGLGKAGDILVLFSTSGKSKGLQLAVDAARSREMKVIACLGKGGGPLKGQCDVELIVASDETARIQEAHTLILHLVLEEVDRHFA